MATDQELYDYYANLLIIQYAGKEKASETIEAVVKQIIMNQLPLDVENAFDIDEAVGDQLDVIGKYAGVTRRNGTITLDDDDFRTFIKLKIIQNTSGSSLYEIQNLINTFFAEEIYVFDYQTMRISYLIDEDKWSSDLATIAITQDLLPFPMSVERGATIYAPSDVLTTFFGFRTYENANPNASPFNTYDDYQYFKPWLLYSYATFDPSTDYSLELEDGGSLLMESGYEILLD
jgi:hypothetical protein